MTKALALLATILGMVGIGGAQIAPTSPAMPVPFQITITLPVNPVPNGSDVVVDVVLANSLTHEIVLAECGGEMWDEYSSMDVRDDTGKPASGINCTKFLRHCQPPPRQATGSATTDTVIVETSNPLLFCDVKSESHRTLQPGAVLSKKIILNQLFALKPGKYTFQLERVNYPKMYVRMPGKYGEYKDLELDDKIDTASSGFVKSNVATLVVTQ